MTGYQYESLAHKVYRRSGHRYQKPKYHLRRTFRIIWRKENTNLVLKKGKRTIL